MEYVRTVLACCQRLQKMPNKTTQVHVNNRYALLTFKLQKTEEQLCRLNTAVFNLEDIHGFKIFHNHFAGQLLL